MPITSKAVNSNPAHVEVFSMEHHVIKFVSHLRQVGGFLLVLRQDVTEIMLKVSLISIPSIEIVKYGIIVSGNCFNTIRKT